MGLKTRFYTDDKDKLIMHYIPSSGYNEIKDKLELDEEPLYSRRTFTITKRDVVEFIDEKEEICVQIGIKKDNLILLNKEIFNINHEFAFQCGIEIKDEYIIHDTISIVFEISNILKRDFIVIKDEYISAYMSKDVVPLSRFEKLIQSFPHKGELYLYKLKTIDRIIGDCFSKPLGYLHRYENYIKKSRENLKYDIPINLDIDKNLKVEKYRSIIEKMNVMLSDQGETEENWQKQIAQFVLLLYPKYVICLEKVKIKGVDDSSKELDFLLIDDQGNADILEIKKPFESCVLGKSLYRKNYVPKRELSGAIMQCQKYIFSLLAYKDENEKKINKSQSDKLKNIKVRLINPHAIIFCGRNAGFSEQQYEDFEIIKRSNTNIIDIVTYDDLIKRLQNAIDFYSA